MAVYKYVYTSPTCNSENWTKQPSKKIIRKLSTHPDATGNWIISVSVTAASTLRDIFVARQSFSEAVNNTYMTVRNAVVYREANTHLDSAKRISSLSVSFQRLFSCWYMNVMYVWWEQTLSEGKNISGWDEKVRITPYFTWSWNLSRVLF